MTKPLQRVVAPIGGVNAQVSFPSVHIYDDHSQWRVPYHGRPTLTVPIYKSENGRRLALYGLLPDGADFDDPVSPTRETFFITQGTIEITPKGGDTMTWTAGDLVYWPYEVEQHNLYGRGMGCICYFWSDDPLADYLAGASTSAPLPNVFTK